MGDIFNDRSSIEDLDIKKVITDKGYYDKFGEWNSILISRAYPGLLFRGRVEVLIFKDDCIYIEITQSGYRFPGGSFDIRRSNHDQAYNEAKEEARIITHNIKYSGYSYHKLKEKAYVCKDKKTISWDGTYNKIYTADFFGYYKGYIKSYVLDAKMCTCGDFVPVYSIINMMSDIHKTVIKSRGY